MVGNGKNVKTQLVVTFHHLVHIVGAVAGKGMGMQGGFKGQPIIPINIFIRADYSVIMLCVLPGAAPETKAVPVKRMPAANKTAKTFLKLFIISPPPKCIVTPFLLKFKYCGKIINICTATAVLRGKVALQRLLILWYNLYNKFSM